MVTLLVLVFMGAVVGLILGIFDVIAANRKRRQGRVR